MVRNLKGTSVELNYAFKTYFVKVRLQVICGAKASESFNLIPVIIIIYLNVKGI
jgi:hypothetical protein